MSMDSEYQVHSELMAQYDEALRQSREVQRRVTRAFYDCGQGRGTGPGESDLKLAEELQAHADDLWRQVRAHIDGLFR